MGKWFLALAVCIQNQRPYRQSSAVGAAAAAAAAVRARQIGLFSLQCSTWCSAQQYHSSSQSPQYLNCFTVTSRLSQEGRPHGCRPCAAISAASRVLKHSTRSSIAACASERPRARSMAWNGAAVHRARREVMKSEVQTNPQASTLSITETKFFPWLSCSEGMFSQYPASSLQQKAKKPRQEAAFADKRTGSICPRKASVATEI